MALRHHILALLSFLLSVSISLALPTSTPGNADANSPSSNSTIAKRSTGAYIGIGIGAVIILLLFTGASLYLGCCCCLPGASAPLLQIGAGRRAGRPSIELEYQGNDDGQLHETQPQPHLNPHARAESRASVATEETLVPEDQQEERKSQQTHQFSKYQGQQHDDEHLNV